MPSTNPPREQQGKDGSSRETKAEFRGELRFREEEVRDLTKRGTEEGDRGTNGADRYSMS